MAGRRHPPVSGVGLGLRRALMEPLADLSVAAPLAFLEAAPENWIGVGGAAGRRFRQFTERWPFVCHGLSLSLGGPAPLDEAFLGQVRDFLDDHGIGAYSEHLSYCSTDGQLYELLPIPFTEKAVQHVAARIRRSQDILGRRIAVENASMYATPGQQMAEIDFINAVLDEADCDLLLDVNNVHVNAVNQGYDALEFIRALPGERIAYLHIAGHHCEADDLLVDTHGAAVIEPVWRLLEQTYRHFGVIPTLLERDFNFPPLDELLAEVTRIAELQRGQVLQSNIPLSDHSDQCSDQMGQVLQSNIPLSWSQEQWGQVLHFVPMRGRWSDAGISRCVWGGNPSLVQNARPDPTGRWSDAGISRCVWGGNPSLVQNARPDPTQRAFAAHLRDPARTACPSDVPEQRMAVYRELFHNNLANLLANSFPVLRKTLGEPAWHALVRDFGAEHRARTPLFPELPREFLRYLDAGRPPRAADPPFLLELAHYEWVELALAQDPTELDAVAGDAHGDCLAGVPVLSPLAWPLHYRFPVHRIGPECQPHTPPPQATHLLCYRDRGDQVHFMTLNAVTARLLEGLRQHPERSGRAQLEAIADELKHPQPQQVLKTGRATLEELRRRDVVL